MPFGAFEKSQQNKNPDPEKEKIEAQEKQVDIEAVTEEVQDLHISLAKEYLPEGNELRNRIIDFYSDTERLTGELSRVLEGLSQSEIDERLSNMKERFKTPSSFVEYFSKKFLDKPDHPQRQEEFNAAQKRAEERREENPIATEEEYELGVYKQALETQVQDAVFALFEKGYMPFESGFRENTNRDQYIGVYNQEVEAPDDLINDLQKEGFEISTEHRSDRTIINIHPTSGEFVSLSEWKEVWDELAERMPEAPKEDLSDVKEYIYHSEFREYQDKLREQRSE
jgi:hypothetical protein